MKARRFALIAILLSGTVANAGQKIHSTPHGSGPQGCDTYEVSVPNPRETEAAKTAPLPPRRPVK